MPLCMLAMKSLWKLMEIVNCGLYYKQMTIIDGKSSVIIKWIFKLIDATRGVIYDHHMFIEATD